MYLINTVNDEKFKAKKWGEVVEYFDLYTDTDISGQNGLKGKFLAFSGTGNSIERIDGRSVRDIDFAPNISH